MLAVPQVPVTLAHRAFSASAPELRRPLSQIKIAWNTGVSVTHAEAKVVLALSEYLNAMLFNRLRERHGDAYAPGAVEGGSIHDLNLEAVTADSVLAAARRYLPSYEGAYVRLSLVGR